MNYLKWKKQVRKIYAFLTDELNVKGFKLILPKMHFNGGSIYIKSRKIIISFELCTYLRKELNYKYSEVAIAEIIMMHELGHYFQYLEDKEQFDLTTKELHQLLLNGLLEKRGFEIKKRIEFLKEYKIKIEIFEKEAWNISKSFRVVNQDLFEKVKQRGLEGHQRTIDYTLKTLQEEIEKAERVLSRMNKTVKKRA